MKQRIKSPWSIALMVLVIVSLYIGGHIPYDRYVVRQIEAFNAIGGNDGVDAAAPVHYGQIQPMVVDGFSEEPIAGAAVVIPETNQHFITGEDGFTALIPIPITEDSHFQEIAPKPWGEVTLIIYKEGYIEYVLLHTHVWENQTRKGPKILLFPQTDDEKSDPFTIVEGPHRVWVNQLVEKYRP